MYLSISIAVMLILLIFISVKIVIISCEVEKIKSKIDEIIEKVSRDVFDEDRSHTLMSAHTAAINTLHDDVNRIGKEVRSLRHNAGKLLQRKNKRGGK